MRRAFDARRLVRPRAWTAQRCLTQSRTQSWKALGVNQDLVQSLSERSIFEPNQVQCAAIPTIASGKDLILGAQTGSGKTLAYLLPVMQAVKEFEQTTQLRSKVKKPRALVLVPTRELAMQISDEAKQLSHVLKFRTAVIYGGSAMNSQKKNLSTPVDLLIATPGSRFLRLSTHSH